MRLGGTGGGGGERAGGETLMLHIQVPDCFTYHLHVSMPEHLAHFEEFKSYLDNDAVGLTDRRELSRDVNFLTGRVLTVKVDKNGYFSMFKTRWVCRGFQDKFAWDQQTDSPTATRYGFRLVAQCAVNHYWDLFHLDLKTAFLQGEHYNLSSRMVVVQLPPDIGLPTWMVGLCPSSGLWSERCTAEVVEPFG